MSRFIFHDPQVNLFVSDVDASLAFYRDHFGFVESYRAPGDAASEHVEARITGLTLGFSSLKAVDKFYGVETGERLRGEVVLFTNDVDGACAALADAGVPIIGPPYMHNAGRLRAALLEDPDGHLISLVQRLT